MSPSSHNRSELCEALTTFSMMHPEKRQTTEAILRFIQRTPDGFNRRCREGHMTGSAWLLHPSGDRVLLTLHHKLQRWLQPGGHADGETDMLNVALREATEESGIEHIVPLQTNIFDLDIHTIPARPLAGEEAHLHYDIRYLLQAQDAEVHLSPESDALRWWRAEEILTHRELFDDSVLRMTSLWMEQLATIKAGGQTSHLRTQS